MKPGAGLVGRANPTSLFIGIVAAVSTIAIGIGLVVFATSGNGDDGSRTSAGASTGSTTSTTAPSSTTTTSTTGAAPPTTTTVAAGGGTSGGAAGGGAQQPNLAYSDPTDDPYQPQPLPAGITASITPGSCTWTAANGGQLQASGTITASPTTDDVWFVDVYWLQNDRELDDQFDTYDVDPGQTQTWTLTTSAPLPPAEPFRCALEVS